MKLANRRPDWSLPQLNLNLVLDDDSILEQNRGRQPCTKWYYHERIASGIASGKVQGMRVAQGMRVEQDEKVLINSHCLQTKEEIASKNTGVQAAILAPESVQLHDLEHCPDFDKNTAVVLFPSDDAVNVEDLEPDSISRAFIIDSRWQKAKTLIQHPRLEGVRRVKLSNTKSAFWRYHTKGVSDEGVCTIEAMLHFLNALVEKGKLSDPIYQGGHYFDNLLWYFAHQHKVVQQAAAEKAERSRSRLENSEGQTCEAGVAQQGKRKRLGGANTLADPILNQSDVKQDA